MFLTISLLLLGATTLTLFGTILLVPDAQRQQQVAKIAVPLIFVFFLLVCGILVASIVRGEMPSFL